VGVHLFCGAYIGMSEQILDVSQVHADGPALGGEGMAQTK